MRTKSVRRSGNGIVILLCFALAMSCGDPAAKSETKLQSSGTPKGFIDIELGSMKGQPVEWGVALSGDQVPLLVHGNDGNPSKVSTVSPTSAKVEDLPPLPTKGWLADAELVATDSFVIVNSHVCSTESRLDSEGMNWLCSGGETTHSEIFVFDLAARLWYHKILPESDYMNTAIGPVEPTRAMFGGTQPAGTDFGTAPVPVLALALTPDLPVVPGWAPATGARCSQGQSPELTFDRSASPSAAVMTTAKTGEAQTVAVPAAASARLREVLPNIVDCHSASRFLAVPGNRTPRDEEIADADRRGIKVPAPDGPTTAAAPQPPEDSDPAVSVFDLSRPDAPPVKVGDSASLWSFVAGDKYWAVADDAGLHLHDVASGKTRLIEISSDDVLMGLPTGVVLLATDDDSLASISIAVLP